MDERSAKVKSEALRDLPVACSDEAAAFEFMERQRWGDSPVCAHCGSSRVYQMKSRATGKRNRRYLWRCTICQRQYTVKVGTVMEDSAVPLRHWCYAFWAACASKKGVSALQIRRMTGLSYKSTLFLMHRIRFALAGDPVTPAKLEGIIEADETYVGGKPRYKGPHNKRGLHDKTPVFALVVRGGGVRARVPDKVTASTLGKFIARNVNPMHARLITDESWAYTKIGRKFFGGHDTVNHSRREYARGDVTTNTVEGFFSLLKRGLYGTFHSVSDRHLHRYVAEFEYRYNTRKMNDGERTTKAIQQAVGKRLLYSQPSKDR